MKVSLATVQGIRVIESGLEVTVTISETEAPTEPTEPSDETESTEA